MFADESFDIINYAYVLHEMPGDNAQMVIDEMYRLLAPGGVMNGFEVPYFESDIGKTVYSLINTWGYDWDVVGDHGPEPYIHEYEFETVLPEYLESTGWVDVEVIDYSFFESIFLAYKPLAPSSTTTGGPWTDDGSGSSVATDDSWTSSSTDASSTTSTDGPWTDDGSGSSTATDDSWTSSSTDGSSTTTEGSNPTTTDSAMIASILNPTIVFTAVIFNRLLL